ncbi:MAG: dipeptidase [Burkholderiaceae bacterium]
MEAAERIHKESIVIDATCPLLTEDATHLHLCRAGGVTAVAPTIRANTGTSADAILKFGYWLRLAREDDQVVIVRKAADIQVAKKAGKIGVILHFQGTEVLDKSVDIIDAYHALGLRVVQITYNKRCHVGDGIEEPSDAGLSRYGKSVVRRLNDTKIIVDCSHTGLRTSLEAVEYSNAPVVLSHANPRAVRDVPRNVPDDLYRAIAASGGVIGVAGFPNFVAASPRPTLDQFIDHIVHIADLVGIDHVGLGIDYYLGQDPFSTEQAARALFNERVEMGVWSPESYPAPPYYYPQGIETPDKLGNLTPGLLKRGFSEADVRKILGLNWMRVYTQVWG